VGQCVFYVDDDQDMCFLVTRMLERRGYRVRSFTDQRLALAALRDEPGSCALLVTDYNMPGMSGVDVARECRAAHPQLPVALASGYITDALRAEALEAGVRELIFKPHMADHFLDVVAALVPGAPGRQPAEKPPSTKITCPVT
jgi:two-component system cell cycle sensor histidine kinase/response regulator CckA